MNPKLRLHLAALALGLAAVPVLVAARAGSPRWQDATTLDDAMQTLQAGVRGVEKALDKSESEKALGLLLDMQQAAHTAKTGTPAKAGEIADAAEKARFLAGYRLKIIDLERGLLDVEAALVAGKIDDAKKALAERVKPLKKEGHDAYKD